MVQFLLVGKVVVESAQRYAALPPTTRIFSAFSPLFAAILQQTCRIPSLDVISGWISFTPSK